MLIFFFFPLGYSLISLNFVSLPLPLPSTQIYWGEMEQELRLTDDHLLAALAPKDTHTRITQSSMN